MASTMSGPVFVLVEPQLPENIGAVARAMGNFGMKHLRIVSPKCSVLDKKAIAMSAGADVILHQAQIFDTVDDALADCHWVYGTCAIQRHMIKKYTPLRNAVEEIAGHPDGITAILFGPERTGLHNADLVKCRSIIQIPVNPDFSSLNLAQAVILTAYEWFQFHHQSIPCLQRGETSPASQKQIQSFLCDLNYRLDNIKFWRIDHKKPIMWQNIQNIFIRMDLTEQEVRTLRGMIRLLYEYQPEKAP